MLSGRGSENKEHRPGMPNEKWKRQSGVVGSWSVFAFGIFFTFSAAAKTLDLRSFWLVIEGYGIISGDLALAASIAIPVAEFSLGTLLLLKSHVRTTLLCLMVMVAGFTVVSYSREPQGTVADCGCFGSLLERKVDNYLLVENLAILAGLFISWITWRDQPTKKGG